VTVPSISEFRFEAPSTVYTGGPLGRWRTNASFESSMMRGGVAEVGGPSLCAAVLWSDATKITHVPPEAPPMHDEYHLLALLLAWTMPRRQSVYPKLST